jgi:hypothetical protein
MSSRELILMDAFWVEDVAVVYALLVFLSSNHVNMLMHKKHTQMTLAARVSS